MSWSTTPSRPAPPITSTTPSSLFGSSLTPSRSSRSLASSSASATSLLTRQKAEMDDDKLSIRSGRSGRSNMTMNGNARSRGASFASVASGRTVVERRSSDSEDGADMEMELEVPRAASPVADPGEEEAVRARPETSVGGGTVPQVVKRQRLAGAPGSEAARRSTWFGTSAWGGGAAAEASTVSPPPPTSSSEASATTLAPTDPKPTSTSPLPSSLPPPSAPISNPVIPPSPTPIATTLAVPPTPTPRTQPTSPLSHRTSWWSLASAATEPPSAPPAPLASVPDEAPSPPAPRSSTKAGAGRFDVPGLAAERERAKKRAKDDEREGQRATLGVQPRGWLSLVSLSRSASLADVPSAAVESDGGTPTPANGGAENEEGSSGTPKGRASPVDDATLTPTPRYRQAASVATVQRLSWWDWAAGASVSEPGPIETVAEEREPPPEREPEPEPVDTASSISSLSLGSTISTASAPRTWRQTIWGEYPQETALRVQKAQAQQLVSQAEAMIIGAPPTKPVEVPNSPSTLASEPASVSPPVSAPVHTLKHKASWAFFPRGSSDATPQSSPPATLPLAPSTFDRGGPTLTKPHSLLSKSFTTVTPSASSRASSRSRDSAPNSPHLGPQPDGPLKPLTGSIRSGPRTAAYEADPPFENLVLPTFEDTFLRPPRSFPPRKSKLIKAVSVVSAYLFSQPPRILSGGEVMRVDPAERLPKSFETMGELPRLERVKRVVTIGVHGWFPNPRLKSVFGEPTGTSVKFATMMHDSVQSYLESHDLTSFNIQAIALEGDGQVDDRVSKLYLQLVGRPEWVEALKKADVVFLATHSQGSIVSTHLLAKMVEEGLVTGAKTHMLAMCGIAQGPFVYLSQSYALSPYFTYLESAAARELFEFQDPDSIVAIKFLESLRIVLSHGMKITTVGSINDQVVPLYSALFSGINHPSILRAVYIDSAAFRTSDFLANLVVFAARLRNAGLQDHDLTYHLSEALAGALTGVGHSKIYEEDEVFTLAVRYHFETTGLADAPTHLHAQTPLGELSMSFAPKNRRNPYLLTWALRGIIEDPQVRKVFGSELTALREAFETWKPVTKVLKDVKLKLEGIRMLPRAKEGKL